MAGSTRRWSKRKYQEHIFDLARGKPSRHAKDNGAAESRGWFNLTFDQDSMSDMFEENSVRGSDGRPQARDTNGDTYTGWATSGAAERERFRQDQQEELRKQFRQNVKKHPAFRNKTDQEIGEIADAYLSGDDFDGDDKKETAEALKEVANYTTGDNEVAMSDERVWRNKYHPTPDKGKGEGGDKTSPTDQVQKKGESSVQLTNGRRVTSDTPLAPRTKPGSGVSPVPPPSVGTTTEHGGTGLPTDSHIRMNGGPLDIRNTSGNNSLAHLQNEQLKTAEIQAAEGRRDAQSDAATSEVSRLQRRRAERLRQDKTRYALEQEAAQFREQQRADMMERRYKNRSFRNADDWANLGRLREGEQMLDQKDYDVKVGDLVDRAKKLRSPKGRAGLGSTDLQDMDMVFKTVGKLPTTKDDKGNVSYGGNLTPAQIEALGKRISGFETRAKSNQAYAAAQAEAFNRRAADKYRQQYGLQGFSDEDVLGFHKARTAKTANDALDRMLDYGKKLGDPNKISGADREAALRQYEKDWDTIRGNVDTASIFNRAMEDKATKDKFMSDIADIGTGPGADIKQANLRRDTILRQMYKERAAAQAPAQPASVAGGSMQPVPPKVSPQSVPPRVSPQMTAIAAGLRARNTLPLSSVKPDPIAAAGIRVPDKGTESTDVPVEVGFAQKASSEFPARPEPAPEVSDQMYAFMEGRKQQNAPYLLPKRNSDPFAAAGIRVKSPEEANADLAQAKSDDDAYESVGVLTPRRERERAADAAQQDVMRAVAAMDQREDERQRSLRNPGGRMRIKW